jgi:2-keto-4-pentenoate hydratase/2-oxohepta-3-ene-1,7-dioic acid hydratase in catechol pathway
MRWVMLQTDGGRRLAAEAASPSGGVRYLDAGAVDPGLPQELQDVLALPDGLSRAAAAAREAERQGRFAAGTPARPIAAPGKVICIGLNYRDHAAESGQPIPHEPVCFGKFSSSVVGPGDAIVLPRAAERVDYEAELVVVIGRRGKRIPRERAMEHVAGYMCGNDVSARDWQIGRPGGQWLLGKTPDTFAPIGPCLATADEVPDPQDLRIRLRLNGETVQDSSTRELIFSVDRLIAHLSQLITLEPGDLIFTGTPPGVGMARKPPLWLKPGDRCEVEIERVGCLANPVRAEE